jgi:hypothetical protein
MKLWTLPSNYAGQSWPNWYVFLSQHRDSDALTRSNFQSALKALGGESDTVQVIHEGHWAVGWVKWIGIEASDEAAVKAAEEMEERLANYPILDETDFSQVEDEDCVSMWECFDTDDRIRYFRKHRYTATSIASLLRAVRGSWYDAANMLHCPSDILY